MGIAGVGGGVLISACGSEAEGQDGEATADAGASCSDLSGLSEAQRQQRQQMTETLNYVEETPNEEQYCSNCALYTPPEQAETTEEQCGGCQLFPGPVSPNGYCTSWAPAA